MEDLKEEITEEVREEELEDEKELDENGEPIEQEKPLFMLEEDEPEPEDDTKKVPLGTLKWERKKFQGRLSEKDNENKELKARLEKLESSITKQPETKPLDVPVESDFATDEEYKSAMVKYHNEVKEQMRKDLLSEVTTSKTQE